MSEPHRVSGSIAIAPSTPLMTQRFALTVFSTTFFLSALLLFTLQPMFAKMVLPRLGGSPSVWSIAMVMFQTFLFAGYLYAHLIARHLRTGSAAILHLAFLGLAGLTLPLGIAAGYTTPPTQGLMLWTAALFASSVGIPFIALSATAPLLQHWFLATGHPQANNPYVFYATSNLGSFSALLLYPFVVEPNFAISTQTLLWSVGFSVLALCVGTAACLTAGAKECGRLNAAEESPSWRQRSMWPLLTAVPAGLCVAVTSFITTDLASAPFLWMLPLALYLLTFVAVFREKPWLPHGAAQRFLPYVIAPLAISLFGSGKTYWFANILLNLAAFTLISLACHGEAYRRRPQPSHLTEFYLWTSFGGVLGGAFAGLAAPHLFNNIYEYPLLIVAALAVLPDFFSGGPRRLIREAAPGLIVASLTLVLWLTIKARLPLSAEKPMQMALVALAAFTLFQANRPVRFASLVVFAFVLTGLWRPGLRQIEITRDFFGVHQVVDTADGTHGLLFNGTTIHGAELIGGGADQVLPQRPEPLTYYYRGGPLSDVIEAARGEYGPIHAALVGLGTGSLACYERFDEHWTFFEIDREVVRIARDPRYFHFMSACAPDAKVVLGDARLTLLSSSQHYDLIVLDAFSSDAIPVHLLTREAFAGYRTRLAPHGMIAVHVSNRHMELASVVAAVAAADGLVTYEKQDKDAGNFTEDYRANAEVVTVARSIEDLGDLPSRRGWRRLTPLPDVAAWTDDYSDVLHAMLRKGFSD